MSDDMFDDLMDDCSQKLGIQFNFDLLSFEDVMIAITCLHSLAEVADPGTLCAFMDVMSGATDVYLPDLPFSEASALIERVAGEFTAWLTGKRL